MVEEDIRKRMEVKISRVEDFVWPGKVTHVINPHCFWIQVGSYTRPDPGTNLNTIDHHADTRLDPGTNPNTIYHCADTRPDPGTNPNTIHHCADTRPDLGTNPNTIHHCADTRPDPAENLNPFEHLQQTIQSFGCHEASRVSSIEELEPGQLVLVDHENEASYRWKRGQVVHITSDNSVEVFFSDYGNTKLVAADKLCIKFPPQFKALPPQAVRCSLAGIKPISKSWPSRGIRTFKKLTTGQLNVLVLSMELSHLEVSLYSSNNTNSRSVSHLLLDEEVAMLFEGHEVPEYLDDIPAFTSSRYIPPKCYMIQMKNADIMLKSINEDRVTTKSLELLPPCMDKYMQPHQKSTVQSGDQKAQSADPRSSNVNSNKCQCQTSASRDPKSSSDNLSPQSEKTEPVVDFYPYENVSVHPPPLPESSLKLSEICGGQGPLSEVQYNSSSLNKGTNDCPINTAEEQCIFSEIPAKQHDQNRFVANFNHFPSNDQELVEASFYSDNNSSSRVVALASNAGDTDKNFSYDPETNNSDISRPRLDSSLIPPRYIEHFISSPGYQSGHLLETYYQVKMDNQSNLYPMYSQTDMSQKNVMLPVVNSPMQKEDNNGVRKYEKNPHSSPEEQKGSNLVLVRQQFQEQRSENNKMTLKLTMPQNVTSSEYSKNDGHRQLECADSPTIDSFNLGNIDHTNMLSADHFYKKSHLEKLQALQEEAKHIAKESAEQSNLMNIPRYGQRSDEEDHTSETDYNAIDYNLLEPLAEEIQRANKDRKELRKSSVDKNSVSQPAENPARLEPLPFSYILDIDFSKAVKEALDFGKTNGMEKIKHLMDAIVESLKTSQAEKQLNNVLSMLLSKAIKEYMCREIVVKTINQLNSEMEITECLVKLLKAQQMECIRVAGTKMCYHEKFSQVMALIYKSSLDWHNSASIQDGILGIVEKWIVFNHKGTQKHQVDKQNVFLDCFVSFWEISKNEILQHNQSFWSRIQSEIRKNLLNEGVSRSIREKLLDIMMTMFTLNVDNRDIHTQTSHGIMIPESCQVQPSVCDKGTLTESDWIEEIRDEMYSDKRLESVHFGMSEDYLSEPTEPVVHQRTQSSAEAKTSTSKCSSAWSSNLFSSMSHANTPINLSDISKMLESTFMPPQELLGQKLSDAAGSENRDAEDSLLEGNLEPLLLNHLTENCGASVNTVAEKKSALGKSIVDWFEYKPSAKDSSVATIDMKQIETKKKQDSTFMEASENDLKLKYSLPKSDNGTKKLTKDKNKGKRLSKMDDNTNVGENIYKGCDKIYGPDVIIKGELEENLDNENNTVSICSKSETFDTEFDASVQREFVVVEHVDKESVAGKQFEDDFGLESDEDRDSVENFDEDHLNRKYMLDVATAVSEKDDAEMTACSSYDKNFPKLGFLDCDMMPSNQEPKLDAHDKMGADVKYGKKFRKTNLADFLINKNDNKDKPESAHWIPGSRKCLLCHDEGHISEKCPSSFVLFQ